MLVAISLSTSDNPRVKRYNFYNTETGEVSNMQIKNIKKALENGIVIAGFTGYTSTKSRGLRLNSYFQNLGIVGEDDGNRYYTVVKRKEYASTTRFIMVDKVGNDYEIKKDELIQFIEDGVIVAGVKLYKDCLRVSNEIEIEITK